MSLPLSFGKDSWIVKLNAGNRHIELGLWVTIANIIERRSIKARISHKYWRGPRGKVIQDSFNWILDCILDPGSLSVELGFRISIVSGIPDS